MKPKQIHSLNCALCGELYDSKEAFPKEQVCPKCVGEEKKKEKSVKRAVNKIQQVKIRKKKKQSKKARKRNRKK